MHLKSYRVENYRRLRNVHIELSNDISIYVGANNSGKTRHSRCSFSSGTAKIAFRFLI